RLRPVGLAPAVTLRRPSRTIAWASTVAVVVPSPATSLVFVATSLTSWAPRFSYGLVSSISLAIVTPSLVMVGAPNFLSSTTLRPRGPRVTLTVSARVLTPCSSRCRASSEKLRIFAISVLSLHGDRPGRQSGPGRRPLHRWSVGYFSMTARTSRAESTRYSSPEYLTSVPPYLE